MISVPVWFWVSGVTVCGIRSGKVEGRGICARTSTLGDNDSNNNCSKTNSSSNDNMVIVIMITTIS